MVYQDKFMRYEKKYLITKKQRDFIIQSMAEYMEDDEYGRSTICNIYFDTPSKLLIRRSIEKPIYKEKLRLRSYGIAQGDSTVYVEIKKKFQSVVYKRRIDMREKEAMEYLIMGKDVHIPSQISSEIDFFFQRYQDLSPSAFLSYEREAYYAKDDREFRVSFDENILWRDYDFSLCKGAYGTSLLSKEQVLMEVKTISAIPLWMTKLLSDQQIFSTSYSKYGNAYVSIHEKTIAGGKQYA